MVDSSKIIKIGSTYIGTTGHASTDLIYRSYFANKKRKRDFRSVQAIFETYRAMQKVLKDDYFLIENEDDEDPYESLQMSSLLANPYGIFGVYRLRSVKEYTRFYAFGSGDDLAMGAMYVAYPRMESVEDIARVAIAAACEFDDGSGLPATVHTVKLSVAR